MIVNINELQCMLGRAPTSSGKRHKSILKVKVPMWRDFHVHGVTGDPYWPILACGTRVHASKNPIF